MACRRDGLVVHLKATDGDTVYASTITLRVVRTRAMGVRRAHQRRARSGLWAWLAGRRVSRTTSRHKLVIGSVT
jgi:hypothetical protein